MDRLEIPEGEASIAEELADWLDAEGHDPRDLIITPRVRGQALTVSRSKESGLKLVGLEAPGGTEKKVLDELEALLRRVTGRSPRRVRSAGGFAVRATSGEVRALLEHELVGEIRPDTTKKGKRRRR